MTGIEDLTNMEAVYSLHRVTSGFSWVDLEDPEGVRTLVVKLAGAGLGGSAEAEAFMTRFEDDDHAGELARACLLAIQENPTLLEGAQASLNKLLESPPRTQQMDMGISFGILALAGMAMFLSGSLNIKAGDFELDYKGSEAVAGIFKVVLGHVQP